jgi:hypothetical protein
MNNEELELIGCPYNLAIEWRIFMLIKLKATNLGKLAKLGHIVLNNFLS